MIDIHSHILPGVDDGAKTLEEAISMIKVAQENGIKSIFATPHYIEHEGYKDANENIEIFNLLNTTLKKEKINVDIYSGQEIFITPELINLVEEKKVSTLNNSRYVLIELPMYDIPRFDENLIYSLRLKGYVPIIAHPERNRKIVDDPNILYNFIKLGALAQLNLSSLGGYYGEAIKNTAKILVEHNMIHFVGSDAHSLDPRPMRIKKLLNILVDIIGSKRVNELIDCNPQAIIKNVYLDVRNAKQYQEISKMRRFYNLLVPGN